MRETSKIVGLSVIASEEGASLGRVTEVIADLAQGVIVGMILGDKPVEKGILAEDIGVIGPQAVMVPDSSKVKDIGDFPELVEKRRVSPEQVITVMTASGAKLGTLAEIFMESGTQRIARYEVSGGTVRDLTDGTLSLPVVAGMVHGRDTIIIPDSAVVELDDDVRGLKGAWATALQRLKQEYETVSDKAGDLYKDAAEGGKSARTQAKQRGEQAAHVIGEKVEQAREAMEDEEDEEAASSEEAEAEPEEETAAEEAASSEEAEAEAAPAEETKDTEADDAAEAEEDDEADTE